MSFSLRCEHSLGLVTMSISLAVFLVGILNRNFLVHEVLAVHVGNGVVRSFEVGK